MGVPRLEWIARSGWLVGAVLVVSAVAAGAQPAPSPTLRKIEILTFSCRDFAKLPGAEEQNRLLIYLNGYLDGTQKATVWDEARVGERIDRAMRFCQADPTLSLLDAFKRAWTR